jgi:hypothetical protein
MADTPNNRGHRGFNRGRRGPDRRGGRGQDRGGDRNAERNQDRNQDRGQDRGAEQGRDRGQDSRPQAGGPAPIRTENADVAQIMRDIRTRIAQKQGIALTDQQIEELAARRLEAILDVRSVSPDLLDQLRRAAGGRSVEVPSGPQAAGYVFEDETIYETPRGLLRTMRRLLNPILKLLFNPEPLVMALHQQAKLNTAAAARETERVAQQAEWNALQYALIQRLVSELAKLSLEAQHLAQQVESLSAKVDFSDRRVRSLEGGAHLAEVRSTPQQAPAPRAEGGFTATAQDGGSNGGSGSGGGGGVSAGASGGGSGAGSTGDGTRRKRRRRRGRRPGSPDQPMGGSPTGQTGAADDDGAENGGADDGADDGPDDAAFTDSGDTGAGGFDTGRSGGNAVQSSVHSSIVNGGLESTVASDSGANDSGPAAVSVVQAAVESVAQPDAQPAASTDGAAPRDPVEP